MSELKTNCIKCGRSIDFQSTSLHICKENTNDISDLLYCAECDTYLLKKEYEDHLFCHSLEKEIEPTNLLTKNHSSIHQVNNQSFNRSLIQTNNISNDSSNPFGSFKLNTNNINGINNTRENIVRINPPSHSMSSLQQNHPLDNTNRDPMTNTNSNFRNVYQFNMNQGNSSLSTSIRSNPINRTSIITVNRNGIITTLNLSSMEDPNFIINQIINSGYVPNKQIIKSLPEREITEDNLKLVHEKKSCIICLSDFALKEIVTTLPCLHIFHKSCIKSWLNSRDECPLCKHNIKD